MTKEHAPDAPCPCCSGEPFARCCAPILAGAEAAPTALALMRSRYTAYALGNIEYLKDSLDARWQASFDEQSTRDWSEKAEWKGLVINSVKEGGPDDEEGEVDFTASFFMEGADQQLRERARFRKRGGLWRYVDGRVKSSQEPVVSKSDKVGRNDPCPCGSGKKFKKCCG